MIFNNHTELYQGLSWYMYLSHTPVKMDFVEKAQNLFKIGFLGIFLILQTPKFLKDSIY